jgi:AP-1 complex subunit mu
MKSSCLGVVEKLNFLVAANWTVLHSEILGAVKMRSFLSGMPELKLGLNDKLMFEATGRSALSALFGLESGPLVGLESLSRHPAESPQFDGIWSSRADTCLDRAVADAA